MTTSFSMFEQLKNTSLILRKLSNVQEKFESTIIFYCDSKKLERIPFENTIEVVDIVTGKSLNVTGVKNDGTLEYEDSDGFTLKCEEISISDLCDIVDALYVLITPNI